jgi:hypothetical protein
MTDRYVHTIWCDDIRMEMGNKPSFMGVYTGGIVVPALPTVLPRLSVYSWIVTPKERPFKKIGVRIVRDDGTVVLEIQPTDQDEAPGVAENVRANATRRVVMAGFTIGGLEIPLGCKYFGIFVDTESETLEGPKLHVDVNAQLVAQLNPGQPALTVEPAPTGDKR